MEIMKIRIPKTKYHKENPKHKRITTKYPKSKNENPNTKSNPNPQKPKSKSQKHYTKPKMQNPVPEKGRQKITNK